MAKDIYNKAGNPPMKAPAVNRAGVPNRDTKSHAADARAHATAAPKGGPSHDLSNYRKDR
jgi:hypothetical protein